MLTYFFNHKETIVEYFANFGLFLAQTITVVAAIAVVLVLIFSARNKQQSSGQIQITDLSEDFEDTQKMMRTTRMNPAELKLWEKAEKQKAKQEEKAQKNKAKAAQSKKDKADATEKTNESESKHEIANKNQAVSDVTSQANNENSEIVQSNENSEAPSQSETTNKSTETTVKASSSLPKAEKPCAFVVDFDGSMDAHEVNSLRKEITAVLAVATPEDKVVVRLTSPGGVVHGYGLAASQLERVKRAEIPLIAVVDKVAASGGYMMACVAEKIIAAPFAIIGSIGVVAQVPNFHRLLKKNEIDVELHTAGEFKRTLTLFGENTDQGREKFKEELNETHLLFKEFVKSQRPSLDIDSIATGEHWYGLQAKEKGLVDEISTSDDYLQTLYKDHQVLQVKYIQKKSLAEKVTQNAAQGMVASVMRIWQNNQRPQV